MDLFALKQYLQEHKHLPDVPSESEVNEEGINLARMNGALLKKIEELTLYTIDQEQKLKVQTELIQSLIKRLEKLEKK